MTHGGNLEGSIKQKFFMRAEVAHGAINRARREKSLAEVGEVEVEGEGIALRGIHVNGGGAGGKVFGVEVEPQSGADEEAAAVLRAGEIGLAGRREGPELPVSPISPALRTAAASSSAPLCGSTSTPKTLPPAPPPLT